MVERERHTKILRILKQDHFITVKEIAELLHISESTIRRDLSKLAHQGLIKRFRGGAELSDSDLERRIPPRLPEMSLEYRKGILTEKKRMIARKAVSLIGDDDTIIIDGGSTTYHMVEFLKGFKIQIITNSFAIAEYLIKNTQNTVIIVGGIVYPDSQVILNPFDNSILKNYYASKVFMGVKGIDESGATNSDPLLIQMEKMMIENGKDLIILADSSKFLQKGNLRLCGFDRIKTIITNKDISEQTREMLLSKNINLIVV